MSIEQACNMVNDLGNEFGTRDIAEKCQHFIRRPINEFSSDYAGTSQRKRYSTGRLEKKLFEFLARITKGSTNRDVRESCSRIMIMLGYDSYRHRENRYKQKVENTLKKLKKEGKSLEDTSDLLSDDDDSSSTIFFPDKK